MKGLETSKQPSWWGVVLTFHLTLLLFVAQGDPIVAQVTPVASVKIQAHKIQVSDPALGRRIEAMGGHLIADYGAYRLYETPTITPEMLADARTEIRDSYNTILLHAGHLDTHQSTIKSLQKNLGGFTGKRLHLIQFAGPTQTQWREQLLATGVQIISYIPENSYLVYGDAKSLAQLQGMAAIAPHVQWEGTYENDYKIHPRARLVDERGRPQNIGTDVFDIQLVADKNANSNTLQILNQLKLEPFKRQNRALQYLNVEVRLNPRQLNIIAAQPDVVAILPRFPRKLDCERQDQIVAGNLTGNAPSGPGYLAWLASVGFTQAQFTMSGFVVDISDSGIDNGTTSPNHFGLYVGGNTANASRVAYSRYELNAQNAMYPTNSLAGCDGHGTIDAHIVAGYDNSSGFPFADASGFHYGLGVCPFVKIGASVIFDSADNDLFYAPVFDNLQSDAYHNGARISNNSWSDMDGEGIYNSDCQNYDALVRDAQPDGSTFAAPGNQSMVILFAAGNDGTNPQSIDAPGTAKNVITVGAAENVQAFGGSDASHVSDLGANNANEVSFLSSRGPCADGRFKPDIMAPGTHVSGGVAQATNNLAMFPNGDADSCYSGFNVSGGPGGSIFWPAGQQFYTASSGTSQATPAVAGGCALILQYFLNNFTNLPSPAMTKAYLINSARYLTGASANDTLPSGNQGMGEMNLGTAFDGTSRIVRDQLAADLFTNSGQFRSVTGVIAATNKPFRVTLAWTDAPGSLSGNAYNNNLDLVVIAGGHTYKGNVFNGAFSTPGGDADTKNNVESVFLPAGISGSFAVTVTATSINSIGVPNDANALNQDFALVVYNGTAQSMPFLVPAGTTLLAENCFPSNGIIDSGEMVTLNFGVQNIGTTAVTNLVATLGTNSGVIGVSGSQNYGVLPPASDPVSKLFTFTANVPCGTNLNAALQLQAGTSNFGTFAYTLPVGQFVTTAILTQEFDDPAPPDLPPNWTSSATGTLQPWTTTENISFTFPNCVFAPDTNLRGISELDAPAIAISSATAQLTFQNFYDLEALPMDSSSPTNAIDGGVLEIQIDSGAFMDILSAGGSFVSGGYNAVISATSDNPLAGRAAWSGNPGDFVATTVNLPVAAAGHTVRLRWRCATSTGNIYDGMGWYIDSVSLVDSFYQCCNQPVSPTIVNPQIDGSVISFLFQTVKNQTYYVQFKNSLTDPMWTTFKTITGDGLATMVTDDNQSQPQRFYRITSP